jgi:hypothetical protein
LGSAAIVFGGGFRAYLNKHFGLSAGLEIMRSTNVGAPFLFVPTVGFFGQSK